MSKSHLPSFTSIDPDKIEPQLKKLLEENKNTIQSLLDQKRFTWNDLLLPLDEIDDQLHQFWAPIGHCHSVINNERLRNAYQKCIPLLSAYSTDMGQNVELYRAIDSISKSDDYQKMDAAQQQVIKHYLRDFKLAGVTLDERDKKQFKQLKTELAELSNQFEQHVMDATDGWSVLITEKEKIAGITEQALISAKNAAAEKKQEGWLFNLEFPSYLAVMTHADDQHLRKTIYNAYVTRASDQGPNAGKWDNSKIMENILMKRQAVAKLLDFKNYAEYSLATKMAHSTDDVIYFLTDLVNRSKTQAKNDFQTLREFAKKNFQIDDVNAWDIPYLSEKYRQHHYQLSQEELRPYFPVKRVIEGMFTIVNKLYGIRIKPLTDIDTWHPDVTCYALYDETEQCFAHLYMDLYARPNKRAGAWMDDCATRRRRMDGTVQTPIAFLTCNFASPTASIPSLLTHDDVLTLFHEFGHCLHHLSSKIDYLNVSGINGVEWDAVELPSQFFENWCWETESLKLISGHYQTEKSLLPELIEKLQKARHFQSAMQLIRQLEYSFFDFRLHLDPDISNAKQIQSLLNDIRQEIAVMPIPTFNRFQHSFSHVFGGGYAAGYYSYKWAEVLAADAYSKFEENGIFDRKTGQEFMKNILQKGGSQDAMTLFIAFRGRKPTIDALLRHTGIA